MFLRLPFLNPTFLPSGAVCRAARSRQGRVLCGGSGPLTARTARPPFREEGRWAFCFWCDHTFTPCESGKPIGVATVATLPSALSVSASALGASWVFSFQPVLPPVYRPPVPFLEWKLGQALDAVTGTRLWASYLAAFQISLTRRLPTSLDGCCVVAHRPLRLPTTDATRPPAFAPWQRSLVSSRSFHHARPASGPSAAGHNQPQTVPGCDAYPVPIAFANTDRLPC